VQPGFEQTFRQDIRHANQLSRPLLFNQGVEITKPLAIDNLQQPDVEENTQKAAVVDAPIKLSAGETQKPAVNENKKAEVDLVKQIIDKIKERESKLDQTEI